MTWRAMCLRGCATSLEVAAQMVGLKWSDAAHGPGLGDAYDRVKHGQIRSEAPSKHAVKGELSLPI